jgi:hypothetical protein
MELTEFEHEGHAACPYCAKVLDVHAELIQQGDGPKPGDVTICWGCVGICMFDEDLGLRLPTDEEFNEIYKAVAPVQALIHKMKASQ